MSVTDRLYRRILMSSASITIAATDDTGPVHKVQGRVRGTPETIDNLQVVQLYGVASHAPVGSDAFVTFGNGDRSNGVVHATANQKARPRNQKPGEVTIFTDEGDAISLQRNNVMAIKTKTANVAAETQTSITSPDIRLGAGSSSRASPGDVHLDNSNLTLAFPPTSSMHAASKGYVDAHAGGGGPEGPPGPPGEAATIAVGTTTTGAPGTSASVTNSGNSSAAVFNFTIPRGDVGAQGNTGAAGTPGAPGIAATIAVGTTTTGAPGTNASVTNSGNSGAAVFNFTIPRGDVGAQGPSGADSTVPGPPGADSTVPGPPGPEGPPGPTYTLPHASTTVLGGVMVDGTTITINANGTISAKVGGSIWDVGLAAVERPDQIAELRATIADLTARIAALEARP